MDSLLQEISLYWSVIHNEKKRKTRIHVNLNGNWEGYNLKSLNTE